MGNSPSSSSSYAAQQAESRKTSKDSKKSKRYGGFKKSRSSSNSSKTLPDDGYLQQENIVQVHLPRHHPHYDRVSFLNQQNRQQLDYFDRSDERSEMTADHDYEESETSPKVYSDPIQLISPRKPPNPAKQNPDLRELQRELKFNNKMGINVLGRKSELDKAMEKMKDQMYKKQVDEEKVRNRSDLERELEKRALRLKEYENVLADQAGVRCPPHDEFHRIHTKGNGRFASATS